MDETSVNCGTNEMQSTGLCSGHFGEREFACIFMKRMKRTRVRVCPEKIALAFSDDYKTEDLRIS